MQVDPRAMRFTAAVTTAVLAVVLVTGSGWLLVAQAAVFAIAVVFGMRASPYGFLFRKFLRPRLTPPSEMEAEAPPRFAQGVGLLFAVAGILGYFTEITSLAVVATSVALLAAFLNAAFGFCLGCETYLIIRRFLPAGKTA
ncbi:DUF4395 domain-containing protein [Rhizohabitans arisaemae]|uniref:DUF4395 domain-containing protein n=1 Tax=Rhizohabitans arisaemae TaxID=2720610 RepID=UPI0024B24EF9|nr:DUF4395 domain-containing protein [Rhizohabitans arisaemae]